MHKSSFQSMEKFKNNYLNPEDSLNILDIEDLMMLVILLITTVDF